MYWYFFADFQCSLHSFAPKNSPLTRFGGHTPRGPGPVRCGRAAEARVRLGPVRRGGERPGGELQLVARVGPQAHLRLEGHHHLLFSLFFLPLSCPYSVIPHKAVRYLRAGCCILAAYGKVQ